MILIKLINMILNSNYFPTVIGVIIGSLLTFVNGQYSFKKAEEKEQIRNTSTFYYLMLLKLQLIKSFVEAQNNKHSVIFHEPFITTEEYIMFMSKINSVYCIIGDSDVRELVSFISNISQLEAVRKNCFTDLQESIQLRKDNADSIDKIIKLLSKDNENEKSQINRVIEILDKLESKLIIKK